MLSKSTTEPQPLPEALLPFFLNGLTMFLRLALNLLFSCLNLPSSVITGVHYCIWLSHF